MIRHKSSKSTLSIVIMDLIHGLNITNEKTQELYKNKATIKLVRASFVNDRNENVKTTEWAICPPNKNEYTMPLISYISDRKCSELIDKEIQIGDVFCTSRVVEGKNNHTEWATLIEKEDGSSEIKEISKEDFEELLKEKKEGKDINIIY